MLPTQSWARRNARNCEREFTPLESYIYVVLEANLVYEKSHRRSRVQRFYAKKTDMEFELLSAMRGSMTGIASRINSLSNTLGMGVLTQEQYDTAVAKIYEDYAGPVRGCRRLSKGQQLKACGKHQTTFTEHFTKVNDVPPDNSTTLAHA